MDKNMIALRLLKLQQEFADRALATAAGKDVLPPEMQPRSEEMIAADYATALRHFHRELPLI